MPQPEPVLIDAPEGVELETCQFTVTGKPGFRTCELRHVHCTNCGRKAHKFLKGYTCGLNCVNPGKGVRIECKVK